MVEIEDSVALLLIFQMFYYYNGRLPLMNGLLVVPDGETPPGSEKISLKSLNKMFKDTKFHGLVSLQFLSVLNIFFGVDTKLSKDTITELYKNLSLETLSGQQQIEFEKISDLTSHINIKMTRSMLSNLDRKYKYNAENNEKVKETHEFFKKPSDEEEFEGKINEDIVEPYKHKKTEKPYIPPTVQNVQMIENKTKNKIDDFLKTASEFNKRGSNKPKKGRLL